MGLDFLIVLHFHWLKLLRMWQAAPTCGGSCRQGRHPCNCQRSKS